MTENTIVIDEVEHEILHSLDFGQRTIVDTYIDPVKMLSFEMRSRTTCENCRALLLRLAEEDLATLNSDQEGPYWMEIASDILESWERRAGDFGLIGYAEEGMYWIAVQS